MFAIRLNNMLKSLNNLVVLLDMAVLEIHPQYLSPLPERANPHGADWPK